MPRGVSRVDEARLQRRLWTPDVVRGGLKCWIDYGYGRAIGVSGGDITTVSDPTASAQWSRVSDGPTWSLTAINNLPGASFTASPQETMVSDTYVALTLPLVAVAIFYVDGSTANYSRFLAWASSSGGDSGVTTGLSCMIRDFHTGAGSSFNLSTYFNGSDRCSTAMTYGQVNLCSVTVDASNNIAHFINGTAGSTGALGTSPSWSAVRFMTGCQDVTGASGSGNAPLLGRLGEGVVYCGADAATVRLYLEGYLAHKWRHTASMAGTHRFKSAPPLIGA